MSKASGSERRSKIVDAKETLFARSETVLTHGSVRR